MDGRKTWVLRVADLSGMGLDAQGFTPERMTLYLDQRDYVALRMTMSGHMSGDGESHPMSMTTHMEDYRDVHGLLYPFRASITIQGVQGAMSAGQSDEMRQGIEEMKKRLAEMPPEQRAILEQQMRSMPGMTGMREQTEEVSAGGDLEMTVEVVDLRVNQGPPSGS